jgi:hypothetical protein
MGITLPSIHRRRAAAWLIAAICYAAAVHLILCGAGEGRALYSVGATLTAKAFICPPNCQMIPTEAGTAEPYLPYKHYIPFLCR